jgi:hypothetical protein
MANDQYYARFRRGPRPPAPFGRQHGKVDQCLLLELSGLVHWQRPLMSLKPRFGDLPKGLACWLIDEPPKGALVAVWRGRHGSESELRRGLARSRLMARQSILDTDECALPFFWGVGTIAALTCAFWFLVVYLSHPTVYPNPGLAAYSPPPGTRLMPLQRQTDAPELVELDVEPSSSVTAVAQAQTSEKHAKPSRGAVHKRVRAIPRENGERGLGYAQQWNGYGDWNRNGGWSTGRKLTGDPRPWF